MTKVDILQVPYRGGAPASTDLIAGQIQMIFQTSPEAMPPRQPGQADRGDDGQAPSLLARYTYGR
jgi:tripartite-type tricarboxylate transporter receptor subunit TctC